MQSIVFLVYTLHGVQKDYDWTTDAQVDKKCVLESVVVYKPSDKLCIGGKRSDGKYLQFDSYEAYHADEYFRKKSNGEMHVTSQKYEIPLNVLEQYKVD